MTSGVESPVLQMLEAVDQLYGSEGLAIRTGSPADVEATGYADPEAVRLAYSYAVMTLMSARDHFEAVDLVVRLGQPSVAHWTALRGLLESASLASWLFDITIDADERVSRSLALRFNSLSQQRKMAQSESDAAAVTDIDDRLDAIEQDAQALGFPPIRNRNGARDGIGQRKPDISSLIESEFDLRNTYRFLCGIAHCDSVTIAEVGFRAVSSANGESLLERDDDPEKLRVALAHAAMLYSRALWPQVVQFGTDTDAVASLLDDLFDELQLNADDETRFWRAAGGS